MRNIRRRLVKHKSVEKVIDEVHLGRGVAFGPVDIAIESWVRYVEGSLPYVGELCKNLRSYSL